MNNLYKRKSLAAFTLMELIIYLAVLLVMSVILSNTFLLLNQGGVNVQAKSELNSNFNFINTKIKNDILAASSLNTPATVNSSSGILDLTVNGQSIKYALSSGRVTRQINTQTAEYISSDLIVIDQLNFLRLENYNALLNKSRVSVEVSLSGIYNSSSSDLKYGFTQKTSIFLNQDF